MDNPFSTPISAHFDGQSIVPDEPVTFAPGQKLIIEALPETESAREELPIESCDGDIRIRGTASRSGFFWKNIFGSRTRRPLRRDFPPSKRSRSSGSSSSSKPTGHSCYFMPRRTPTRQNCFTPSDRADHRLRNCAGGPPSAASRYRRIDDGAQAAFGRKPA